MRLLLALGSWVLDISLSRVALEEEAPSPALATDGTHHAAPAPVSPRLGFSLPSVYELEDDDE